jgi:hypothetical protein
MMIEGSGSGRPKHVDPVDADPDPKHYFKVLPEIGNEDIEMEFF